MNSDDFKALFGFILSALIVIIIFTSAKIANKQNNYLTLLSEERNTIVRTGLFKQIYDEYLQDGFEFNLSFDKLLFQEYYNNALDIGIMKNHHEFLIEIDEQQMTIIVDEETETSLSAEFILSDISTIDEFYSIINEFIKASS